jgi:hypothetical protein
VSVKVDTGSCVGTCAWAIDDNIEMKSESLSLNRLSIIFSPLIVLIVCYETMKKEIRMNDAKAD